MNIIIAGAGTVGVNLAAKLSQEGHDLFLIDNHKDKLRTAEENLDIKTIVGDATSVDALRAAHIAEASLLIAVTSTDAINILACQLASKLGTISETLSRALRKLRDRKIIRVEGKKITILQKEALEDISSGIPL